MPSVGTAYVNIRVNTKGFEAGLDKMLSRMSAKMEKAGADLGKDFDRGLKKTNFDASFRPLTNASGKAKTKVGNDIQAIIDMADRMGVNISDAADVGSSGLEGLKDSIGDVRGEMGGLSQASRGADSALGGLGGGAGRGGAALRAAAGGGSFLSRELDDIAAKAPRARATLASLFNVAAFGGTALAGLAGGLSGAAQGIFAIGANAAAAAPALATMTNALMSFAQVGAVAAIAGQGVGEALKAGFAAAEEGAAGATGAVGGMGAASAAAARAVRDAKDALADAYADAAQAAAEAARRTADAERAVAEAQQETAAAQRELNLAREEALEQIEDIGFAAEDAAIAEDRAALALIDARRELQATADLAPNDRARVEAELAFQEAELNYRMAKDRRQDSVKDQQEVAKKGIEATDAMRDARDNLANAEEAEADALRALADARRNEAQVALDNAEAIADAQQNLADAQDQSTTAMQEATAAVDEYQTALDKLSPSQQEFVERILGMREEFEAFSRRVSEPVFDSLLTAMDTIEGSGLIGVIEQGLIGTSQALGLVAEEAATVAASPAFQRSLGDAMEFNSEAIGNFGSAGVSLADAFVQIADAAGPLFVDFSEWVESIADGWAETTRLDNRTGDLRETIETAADRVREFWDLGVELWRTLRLLGSAANRAANEFSFMNQEGQKQQGYIPSLTDSLAEFNDKLEKNPGLVRGFDQALRNLSAVGAGFKNAIIDPLLALGQDPNVEEAFRTLAETDAFDRLAATAGDALPELSELIVNIADILAIMSETGTIDAFVGALADFTGVIKEVAEWAADLPGAGKLLGIAGAALGVYRAVKFLYGGFKFLTAGILGDVRKVGRSIKGFATGFKTGGFKGAVAGARTTPAVPDTDADIVGAITRGSASIVAAVNACCARMVAAMAVSGGAGGVPVGGPGGRPAPKAPGAPGRIIGPGGAAAAAAAGGTAATAASTGKLASAFAKLGKFLAPVGKFLAPIGRAFSFLGRVLGPVGRVLGTVLKFMKPLGFLVKALGFAFRLLLGPIGWVLLALQLLWPVFQYLYDNVEWFRTAVDATWKFIKKIFGYIVDAAGWLWDKITDAFSGIGDVFNDVADWLDDLRDDIRNRFIQIVAFVMKIPDRLRAALSGLWDVITDKLRAAWNWVQRTWSRIVAWVSNRPQVFRRRLAKLWDVITDKLSDAWDWVVRKFIEFGVYLYNRPSVFAAKLAKLWDVITDKLGDAWDWVQRKWESIKNAISRWPDAIRSKLSNLWDGMGDGLASTLNWIGSKLNWLVGQLNGILDKFNVPNISVTFKTDYAFAEGGPVRGPGGPKSDRILARLSDGEYVMPTAASRKLGRPALDYMRQHGELPPGGTGGIIGWFEDKYSSLKDVLKEGAAAAFKWVLSKFKDLVGGSDSVVTQIALGALEYASNRIVGLGEREDEQAAAAGGEYTGPPGGWTYPLARKFIITQMPNSGHSPSWAVDIGSPSGTGVRAASRGVVATVADLGNSSYGRYIVISHAGGQQTLYAHLQSFAVKVGQAVKTGQTIGYSNSTGNSTGPHLHFELKPSSSTYSAMAAHGVRLGSGGTVAPSAAGTLALLAEAGKHERVTPLDSEGFSPAERQMLAVLEEQLGGGGDTIHVHPSQRMNETALADLVARRVAWKRRRGRGSR